MKILFRFFVFLFVFYGFFFLFPHSTLASEDFLVNYNVNYTISNDGSTFVVQNISLINKKTNLYAREYAIRIDSNKIKNISASDRKGSIRPSVSLKDDKTEIRLVFNEEVVGLGNILNFQLKYEDENITKKNGSIWEVFIPGVAEDKSLGDYTVHLHVPQSFGPASYVSPEPDRPYTWSKRKLINGGVSLAFGKEQLFDLTLSYFLENTKRSPIFTEIALPPTTSYQYVIINSIDPKPETVITDHDGNWLARYRLDQESTLIVKANVFVTVLLSPRAGHTSTTPTNAHLQATQYWQAADPRIQTEAKRLKTVKNIYDFVVETLAYDYEKINNRGERKGAIAALEEPKNSVCTEFTDLFVALARAAGIPARQAIGYAYTTNPKLRPLSLVSDILHAWPEYYDEEKKLWVPVDPTWENTTGGIDYFQRLDFNHIVFAYNGVEDDYPYPAGFYRQAGKTGKDIDVRFHEGPLPQQSSSLVSIIQFPSRIFSEFTTPGTVFIRNTGNVGEEHAAISVRSDDFDIAIQKDIPMIPPYGIVSIPFSVHPPGIFYGGERFIYTAVSGSTFHYRVNVTPLAYILLPGAVIVVWIFLILAIIIKKRK